MTSVNFKVFDKTAIECDPKWIIDANMTITEGTTKILLYEAKYIKFNQVYNWWQSSSEFLICSVQTSHAVIQQTENTPDAHSWVVGLHK